MICTGALVSRQDICQEQLGGGWRRGAARGGSCSGSPTASGLSWACSGARSLSHFTAQWGLQTWHCYEPRGHPPPPPTLLLSLLSVQSPVSLTVSSSTSHPLSLSIFLGHPFPAGRASSRLWHRALLCRHSHLTQCGTTWLITNPILGALCVGRVGSVLLSHFIRGHYRPFSFFVCGLMFSVTH